MNNFSVNEVIEMAVQTERDGYLFYTRALERKDLTAEARLMLTRLRDDEIQHEKTFRNLREVLDIEDIAVSGDWEMVGSYLRAIASSHIFNQPDSAINLAAKAGDYREVIENAIAFEKDTLLFFFMMREHVSDEKANNAIKKIIEEETNHIITLKQFLED